MPTYATAAQVNAFIEGGTGLDDETVNRYIDRAEPYIDWVTGYPYMPLTNGRKFNPPDLPVAFAAALRDATCAQVEYILLMGDEFFVTPQYESTSSPDGGTSGKISWIGPKARQALGSVGMIRSTVKMR